MEIWSENQRAFMRIIRGPGGLSLVAMRADDDLAFTIAATRTLVRQRVQFHQAISARVSQLLATVSEELNARDS
jgi:hypothetical protein